ncbi:hypothetical protein Trydic_g14838 [Trypoxylus dichotomus]
MESADYQMALLLERQLQHESSFSSDIYLAQKLQQDFNRELSTENPIGLVYEKKEKTKDDTRSLIDPSWELIDPTPNIHNLFVAFNQRFFWNKLLAVCVSWSKRMTSCAGICYYRGRGGMCSITLSEPLLKLRPRKDLVETLLHEMIHAYLFVTHNNKDRDGHGPEFHNHMYRINREAGTNITVYHSFHDEVRLYQQHWWRCNGPCQHRKPYFGMVRRATNRAPGPYDRWWNEHVQTCGGTFIKVKEPENKTNTNKSSREISKPAGDIRNFVTVTKKNSGDVNSPQKNIKISPITTTRNVHGFTNLISPQRKTLGSPIASPKQNKDDYSVVRSHWANKFPAVSSPVKRNITPSSLSKSPKKKQKIEVNENQVTVTDIINLDDSLVTCPVCDKQVKSSSLNDHLDLCLLESGRKEKQTEQCFVSNKEISKSDYNDYFENSMSDDEEFEECEICNTWFGKSKIETHRKTCIENILKVSSSVEALPGSSITSTTTKSGRKSQCTICDSFVDENELNDHKEQCLLKVFDDLNNKHDLNRNVEIDQEVSCLVCNKRVLKNELNAHLDDCMSGVFDKNNDFNFPSTSTTTDNCDSKNHTNDKYNCPFCMELYTELDMSAHLDECLVNGDNIDNKALLIDSFSSDDIL